MRERDSASPTLNSLDNTRGINGDAFNRSVATRGAKVGQSFFSYDIDEPVSIPRSQSAMIPFLSEAIQARRVSIYNVNVLSAHPLSGARMVNTSKMHLMGGPITVFDSSQSGETSYVGDAVVNDTEPGQTRLFSFAVDLGVDADVKPGENHEQAETFSINQGVLYDNIKSLNSCIYTFKNNTSDSRLIVIEHPISGNNYKLVSPAVADETTADRYRFDMPLAANESKKFIVKEESTDLQTVGLIDCDLGQLFSYSQSGEISPEMKDALQQVLSKRRGINLVNSKIAGNSRKIAAIGTAQDRIRENMKALDHSSALYKRYVDELDNQETALNDLNLEQDQLQNQLSLLNADLSNYIAHLTVQ